MCRYIESLVLNVELALVVTFETTVLCSHRKPADGILLSCRVIILHIEKEEKDLEALVCSRLSQQRTFPVIKVWAVQRMLGVLARLHPAGWGKPSFHSFQHLRTCLEYFLQFWSRKILEQVQQRPPGWFWGAGAQREVKRAGCGHKLQHRKIQVGIRKPVFTRKEDAWNRSLGHCRIYFPWDFQGLTGLGLGNML